MPAGFWDWLSAVIQVYSEFSSKVKTFSILMIPMFPFLLSFRVSTSSDVKKWILL